MFVPSPLRLVVKIVYECERCISFRGKDLTTGRASHPDADESKCAAECITRRIT